MRGTEPQMEQYRHRADQLTAEVRSGADVLEIAPGPGYFALEMARRGARVTGLDISPTMVEIATGHAKESGLAVDFRQGDATKLPFQDGSFDLIVCQAAFKNFLHPVQVLDEMHRVLRSGGLAVIDDMRREATLGEIVTETRGMRTGLLTEAVTTGILLGLRRRAKSVSEFFRLAEASAFGTCSIRTEGMGLEVRLEKA
jgi:ubiquinone/menaquinone biosynthesis C-methylase UbiE